MTARAHMPNTASLFLRSRSQASCQSELPFSISGVETSAGAGAGAGVIFLRQTTSSRFESDLRIHPRLRDVDQEIEQHDERGVKNHGAEDERVVPVESRGDELPPDSRDLENLLDHK